MPNLLKPVPRLLVLLVAAVPLVAQQQQAKRSQFVITKGNDTVAVELFSRDGNALTSEIYQTNGPRTQYTMDLKPDSSISHVEFTRVTQNNQSIGISIFFLDSTVKAQMSAAGQTEQFEFPSRRAIPILVVSFALCEQIVQASHLDVGKSAVYTAIRLGVGDTTQLTVTRFHKDSVSFAMQGAQLKAALGSKGEIIGGVHLGQGWTITRKP
ncbi:MAG TPA: hypothetical protein VNC18_13000 [Gemmatimonadaceae bacterium]|jgi:hypothetical protein|nr:hypothetical protein [Gemmatimonadaceae bacterium]